MTRYRTPSDLPERYRRQVLAQAAPPPPPPASATEREWQQWVVNLAENLGWLHYHVFDSRRSPSGYPDLTLVRTDRPTVATIIADGVKGKRSTFDARLASAPGGAGRVIFAELKTDTGLATPAQRRWLAHLRASGAEAYLWRPRHWRKVQQLLS